MIPRPDFADLERGQIERVRAVRAKRDAGRVAKAMAAVQSAAPAYLKGDSAKRTPLMPLIIDAVRARATVGEISDCLAAVWGTHRPA